VGIAGLVGTRCDETASYGGLVSAAIESGIGIAYTTHAEGITQGLQGGDNRSLASAVISGQWPEPAVVQRIARAG
jgi:flagellar biosynthesis GTPase FlhF